MPLKTEKQPTTQKTPGTLETYLGYAGTTYEWTARRKHEWLILWLREDLKIADTCEMVRTNIETLIHNEDYFSPELRAYFNKDEKGDYKLSPTDPSQVAVLKKLINALAHAEVGLRAIEQIDLHKDRYQLGIDIELVRATRTTVNEIYTTLQLINHTSPDVQNIVGPQISALLPRVALVADKLKEFTVKKVEEFVPENARKMLSSSANSQTRGAVLATAVEMLPANPRSDKESIESLSSLIYALPNYFERLQSKLLPDTQLKAVTSTEAYQAFMIERANAAKRDLESLANNSGVLSLLPSYLSIAKKLIAYSSDLLNTGAPLTKTAYEEAVKKLHEIKHEIFPALIAELEQAEENLGLKTGVLTEPAIKQMNEYYTQLATQVESIAAAAGIIDTTASHLDAWYGRFVRNAIGDTNTLAVGQKLEPILHLTVMMDDTFIAAREAHQLTRLNQASVEEESSRMQLAAARAFFEKIGSYSTWLNSDLGKISPVEKKILAAEYKKFQSHFAAHYPEMDQLIIHALNNSSSRSMLSSAYQGLWPSTNHFSSIMACKEAVINNIQQAIGQAAFKKSFVEKTISHADTTTYTAQAKQTQLNVNIEPFEVAVVPVNDPVPTERGRRLEDEALVAFQNGSPHKKTTHLANQISQLQAAQKALTDFFTLIETQIEPTIAFHELDDTQKEKLHKAYKQIQPYVLAAAASHPEYNFAELNARLVTSLTSSEVPEEPLQANDEGFAPMKRDISATLIRLENEALEAFPPTYYREQAIRFADQTSQLEIAQKALNDFFDEVANKIAPTSNFHELSDTQKETLRKAYKQIQPHVLAAAASHPEYNFAELNARLVTSLTSREVPQTPLKANDESLAFMKRNIGTTLVDLIKNSQRDKKYYLDKEAAYTQEQPLVAKGKEAEKSSLFGQLAELKLSKDVDKFLNEKLVPYLKENLSPEIWHQLSFDGKTINSRQLPFKGFHQDSQEVILYKKLINAVYHLKSSLAGLENLQGAPNSFRQRAYFVYNAFNALVMDVVGLKSNLSAVAGNPQLHALVQENLALLQPLYALPIIGDSLRRTTGESSPTTEQIPVDIVALWENEQDLVAANIDPLSRAKTPAYLKLFGAEEKLYLIDNLYEALEEAINDQPSLLAVKTDIEDIYQALYPHLASTKLASEFAMDYISKLTTEETLTAAVERLREVQQLVDHHYVYGDFGMLNRNEDEDVDFFKQTDNREQFAFYYKRVQPYLAKIDTRYTPSFIDGLKTANDYATACKAIVALQDKLERIANAERQPGPLARESESSRAAAKAQQRLIVATLAAQDETYQALTGHVIPNKDFELAYKQFQQVIADAYKERNMRVNTIGPRPQDALVAAKYDLEAAYKKMLPYLKASSLAGEFPEDFSELDSAEELSTLVAKVHAAASIVNYRSSLVYEALGAMALEMQKYPDEEDYFTPLVNRPLFTSQYTKIQPFLAQIDAKYTVNFAESLESPEDYVAAFHEILALKDQVESLLHEEAERVLNEKVESLLAGPAIPPVAQKPVQQHFHLAINPEDTALLRSKLEKISEILGQKKAPETAQTTKQLEEQRNAKEQELAAVQIKIKAFVDSLNQPNAASVDSTVLQGLLDTRRQLTTELATIAERQKAIPGNATKEVDTKAKAFLEALSSLPLSRDSLIVLTATIAVIEAQMARVGVDDRDQVMASLEKVRKDFTADLKTAVAELETTQGLTAGSLSDSFTAINVQFSGYYDAVVTSVYPTSYLQLVSERLYEISDHLQKYKNPAHAAQTPEERQAKAKVFARQLDGLAYYDPRTAKKALQIINELQAEIAGIGKTSRTIIMAKLNTIRSELGADLLAAADNAEFRLGLKPNTLAKSISDKFEAFYEGFITSFAEVSDQAGLSLLTDTSGTAKRLAREEQRLNAIKADTQGAAQVQAAIFGMPHRDADRINYLFATLANDVLKAQATDSETPLLDIKARLLEHYQKLRPYLLENSELAEEFGESYLSSLTTEEELTEAIENLQGTQGLVNSHPGTYDKLEQMYWDIDWEEDTIFEDNEAGKKNREKFLRLFAELQPYLVQISSTYWPSSFVRELRTGKDFQAALDGIVGRKGQDGVVGMKGQLEELVEGLKNAHALKQGIAEERVKHFTAKLAEEKKAAAEKVEKFKSDTFDNYLHAEVLSQFEELGPYASLFLKLIEPDFEKEKAKLLEDITMDKDIPKAIAEKIEALLPEIVLLHTAGKEAYAALHNSLQQLNGLIAKENAYPKPIENPLRAEKLAWMEAFQSELMKTEQYGTVEAVTGIQNELQEFLDECNDYDIAIKTYETLMQMNAYIEHQEDDKTPDTQAKIDEIGRMQHMLSNDDLAHLTPARRLTEVKAHLKNSNCETVLTKNSDGILMQLVNTLRAFLFGWKSPEQTMFDSFTATLSTMKETHPRPAFSVEASVVVNEESSSLPEENTLVVVGGEPAVGLLEDDVEDQHGHPVPIITF
ncbi:hypothetical protein [Legionella feeleii]|uniref:Protein SidH n=1 Tax=Legionella feeleii TaxID=453 RepID=A0A0W0U668_9GAMM|nr:hypothetical protein [Legionella feeleii]KTD03017.1 protein SidH [Legionella feeleii]SPX62333.1 protein SidH [Legionella feeleii]